MSYQLVCEPIWLLVFLFLVFHKLSLVLMIRYIVTNLTNLINTFASLISTKKYLVRTTNDVFITSQNDDRYLNFKGLFFLRPK